ncbi:MULTISPECIES: hypothetical protein [Trichocoleus]|uniref:Uncharacterized protein n=1 Tax=Trichocoleus desertorum GB2-A4 TaxID=2933944 RepID=A0ABV0J1C9_9CYAN|nr:hypothetical protein [Trichocoleus sp. FACHB-46]MBD1860193.1 hypothetical protein [Trichocoleus sp. FACHB-46]
MVKTVKRSHNWLSRSKNLDLFLLAGCSCLLTLIYQPVGEAFSSSGAIVKGTTSVATTAIVETKSRGSSAIQLTLPERKLDPSQDAEADQS